VVRSLTSAVDHRSSDDTVSDGIDNRRRSLDEDHHHGGDGLRPRPLDDSMMLYIFGTPARTASASCGNDLVKGALGAVVPRRLASHRGLFPALDYFEHRNLPFVCRRPTGFERWRVSNSIVDFLCAVDALVDRLPHVPDRQHRRAVNARS
jgi:hypothetical protein